MHAGAVEWGGDAFDEDADAHARVRRSESFGSLGPSASCKLTRAADLRDEVRVERDVGDWRERVRVKRDIGCMS